MLIFGGLFGFLALALAAYVEHGLKATMAAADVDAVTAALSYQLLHAVILAALGLARRFDASKILRRWLSVAGGCFIAGILLFCGGIYAAHILGIRPALHLAPIGGSLLMLGWLALAAAGIVSYAKNKTSL